MSELKADVLEDYNPFGPVGANETMYRAPPQQANNQPAVLPLSDSHPLGPPPYSTSKSDQPALMPAAPAQDALTVADLQRRQAELDARAAQLDLRERQQQQQEMWRAEHGYGNVSVPNWPPLPRGCCCRPCVRIDFNADIPSQSRWLAKYAHYLWMSYSLVLFLDVFGALSYFIISKTADAGPFFGVAILMAVILPPAAFFCWNRPLYKALKNDSSFSFCVFFPMFGIQLIIMLIQVLGINYLGACGWINSLKTLQENTKVAAFMIFIACLYSLSAAAAAFLLIRAHSYYRNSGASTSKAKQEFAREVLDGRLRDGEP
ncbi:Secretory carrier-associated membrane protein 2 [Sparganum proliferum]